MVEVAGKASHTHRPIGGLSGIENFQDERELYIPVQYSW